MSGHSWHARSVNNTPNHRVSDRLAAIAPSATLAVDAKSKALKAAGEPVINFAPGEPDFPTPKHIVDAAAEAVHDPANYKYTPGNGLLALRQAIADQVGDFGDSPLSPNDVIITNGGKQAVFQAFAAIVNEGDEVLLPAPYWTSYPEMIKLAGGVPIPVVADFSNEYKVTVEQLEEARTDRTIAMVLCSPSNPTGSVYTPEEVRGIGNWALENGVWIITDEIYDRLVYDGAVAEPVYKAVPEVAAQTIALNGVAKSYAMTGWRVGWMVGPKDMIAAATNLQSHSTSNVANVSQVAALAAVSGDLEAVAMMRAAFERRGRMMYELLTEISGVTCLAPQGAFYCFPSFQEALGRRIGGRQVNTTLELADVILSEAKVAIVPGEAFGAPGYARLSFALGDEDLVEGVTRIQKLLS